MSRRTLRIGSLLFLGTAAAFLGLALVREWGRLREGVAAYPWRLEPGLLIGAWLAATAALLLTGTTWTRLHRAAGGRFAAGEGTVAWLGSNLGRYLPGKVWQLAGLAAYARGRGDSAAAALSSSLALQAVTLLTGGAFGLALAGGRAVGLAGGGVGPLLLLAAGLVVLAHPRTIGALARAAARLLGEPLPARGPGAAELVRAAVALCIVWVLYGAGFWALVRGLVGPAAPGPGAALGTFAAAYVAGYLVLVAPGGLVVREGAMAALLVGLGALPWSAAVVLAAAARVWSMAGEAAAFAVAVGVDRAGGSRGGAGQPPPE